LDSFGIADPLGNCLNFRDNRAAHCLATFSPTKKWAFAHFMSSTRQFQLYRVWWKTQLPQGAGSLQADYKRWKLTSIRAGIVTGRPSLRPGRNFHRETASTAFSSRPRPSDCATRMLTAWPEVSTSTTRTTVP